MKPRTIVIAAAVAATLGGGGVVALPSVASLVAERQVDKALKRIRRQSTSVVDRGPVSIELATRSVTVKDISITAPGGASTTTVSALTIVNPREEGDFLSADRVLFEGVSMAGGGEAVTLPRIEISDYSGPDRGLVTTPGVGTNARSQADVIAQVSASAVVIPSIVSVSEITGVRRSARDVTVGRIDRGVVDRASVSDIRVSAPELSDGDPKTGGGVDLTSRAVTYEGLRLPTLWRFYAGDGSGDLEPLAGKVAASDVAARFAVGGRSRMSVTLESLAVEDLRSRPLSYPVAELDQVAKQLRRKEPLTPAEIRRQLLLFSDSLKAVSFGRIGVRNVEAEFAFPGRRTASAKIASSDIGPYRGARVDRLAAEGFVYSDAEGARASLARAEVSMFDASGLITEAEKIGRDEALLNFSPTAEDIVRIAPRIGSVEAKGADLVAGDVKAKFDAARFDLDAPLAVVPQKVSARIDGLDATPPAESWFGRALRFVELDALRGSANFALTLDPTTKQLTLDAFDYAFEDLGHVTARGELVEVDPAILLATGASFIDKLSSIVLAPLEITARNEGAVETLLRRAAVRENEPVEAYRETAAREAQEMVSRLFGPPAALSAEALATFIREPRTIEATISPKTAETRLIDLLQSLRLGPEGIAQTIDVTVLYKR